MKYGEEGLFFSIGFLTAFGCLWFLSSFIDRYDFKIDGFSYHETIYADKCYALRDYLRNKNINSDCVLKK